MRHLTLSFFGTFEVRLNDEPLTNFRSAKVEALLAYLVLNAHFVHRRDVLAALLWPDEPEIVAKRNLRQSLFRLRKVLGDVDTRETPCLLTTRSTVQFNDASSYSLDAAKFLDALAEGRLETAVSVYQGELLPGFSCDSLPFDDWLRQERERLHRLALEALFKLTAHSLTQADYPSAQRWARQQLALEPWREEAHRQLIQTLFLLGERSAALAQVETCRQLLTEELGTELSAATQRLAAHIQNAPPAPQERHAINRPRAQRLTIPFVGRQSEYEALVKAYQQVHQGAFQAITVVGQAGIGKTRLVQQFVNWVIIQGGEVLNGRSFETSAGLSYQPLIHLFRPRLERENAPEDLLSDLWLSQLTRLLPELHERYPDLPQPTQEEATAKQHLFEAITRLGQALAERQPLVLFLDDWHWADSASLDVLHYAAVRWAEAKLPILLLLTLRQEAIAPAMQSWLTRLQRTVATTQLHLSALSGAETEQLLHRALGHGAASTPQLSQLNRWLFAETDGQPLFLTETLKTLAAEGIVQPNAAGAGWQIDWARLDEQFVSSRVLQGVQAIIRSWLNRITDSARLWLTAVSVLAQHATFDHLCGVTGLEELQALAALDELLSKQLLLETAETSSRLARDPIYAFSHQKVSEVVYAEAGTARQRILHRQAFKTLQASAVPAADLAHHALQAGLPAETIRYSLIAGNEAMEIFAVFVAITHYETVWQRVKQQGWPEDISGADRQALYTSLGRAYELTESWSQAQEIYEAMRAYAQMNGAATMACKSLNRLATVHLNLENLPQALALLEQARAVAEQSGDQLGMAEIEWNLSLAARYRNDASGSRHHGEQALAFARELGHRQFMARCLNLLSYAYVNLRQWETVEVYATEALQLYAAVGNQVLAADSQRVIGFAQVFAGRPRESLATLEETYLFSRQIENLWGETDCAYKLALTRLELGDYGHAIKLARQAVAQARQMNIQGVVVLALYIWGRVQRTLMALESAREPLLEILNKPQNQTYGLKDWITAELSALYALAGDWGQAHEYAIQILQAREGESKLPLGLTSWYETEALLRGGDEDLARAEVGRMDKIRGNNKRYRLPLLRSQAVLAQWDGNVAQAVTHLENALTLAQEMELPGDEWPILGELGKLYAGQGEEAKSREAYKEAGTIIDRLAGTIDDEGLREGFVTAVPTRAILGKIEKP